jgi:hypothetical protein
VLAGLEGLDASGDLQLQAKTKKRCGKPGRDPASNHRSRSLHCFCRSMKAFERDADELQV